LVAYADAERGDGPLADANPGIGDARPLVNAKVAQKTYENRSQLLNKVWDGQTKPVEGHDGVHGDLTGKMQPTAAAARQPAHWPTALIDIDAQMAVAAVPAHGDDWSMFTDNEGGPVAVTGNIVMKPALQEQDRFEIDHTKQVGLKSIRWLRDVVHWASYESSD
jgi:hypothetical protein